MSFSCQSPDRDTKGPHVALRKLSVRPSAAAMTTSPPFFYVYYREGGVGVGAHPTEPESLGSKAHIFLFQPHIASIPGWISSKKQRQISLPGWATGVNNNSPAEDMGLGVRTGFCFWEDWSPDWIHSMTLVQMSPKKLVKGGSSPWKTSSRAVWKAMWPPHGFLPSFNLVWVPVGFIPLWVLLGGWKLQWSSKL